MLNLLAPVQVRQDKATTAALVSLELALLVVEEAEAAKVQQAQPVGLVVMVVSVVKTLIITIKIIITQVGAACLLIAVLTMLETAA